MPLGSWCSGNTLVRCREVGTHVGSSSSVPSTRVYRSPWFDPEASCSVFALPVVFLDQVKRLVRYESIAKDSGDLIVWCLCFFVNLYWSWFCVSWCRFLIWEARKQFTILLQHTKMLPDSAIPTPVLTKTGRVPTRVPPFSTTRPSPIVLSRSRGYHANPSR
jgi:hypothetical protein